MKPSLLFPKAFLKRAGLLAYPDWRRPSRTAPDYPRVGTVAAIAANSMDLQLRVQLRNSCLKADRSPDSLITIFAPKISNSPTISYSDYPVLKEGFNMK